MDIETFFDIDKMQCDYQFGAQNSGLDLYLACGDACDSPLEASESGAPLNSEHDLKTAVLISLFTDRRAYDDDGLPDPRGSKRGWWADAISEKIGSRLWLLHREKQLNSVVLRAKEYAAEALQWLIDDGVVEKVEITAEIVRTGFLGLQVILSKTNKTTADFKYEYAWTNIQNAS